MCVSEDVWVILHDLSVIFDKMRAKSFLHQCIMVGVLHIMVIYNTYWSNKFLNFDHFGEILDLFRGEKLLSVSSTVDKTHDNNFSSFLRTISKQNFLSRNHLWKVYEALYHFCELQVYCGRSNLAVHSWVPWPIKCIISDQLFAAIWGQGGV